MNLKSKLLNRIVSFFICLLMLLTIINLPALKTRVYAVSGTGTDCDPILIDTYEQLKEQLNTSTTKKTYLKLTQNISSSSEEGNNTLIVDSSSNYVLDLSGYAIERSENTPYQCCIYVSGILQLINTSDSAGQINACSTDNQNMFAIDTGNNGTIIIGREGYHDKIEIDNSSKSPVAAVRVQGIGKVYDGAEIKGKDNSLYGFSGSEVYIYGGVFSKGVDVGKCSTAYVEYAEIKSHPYYTNYCFCGYEGCLAPNSQLYDNDGNSVSIEYNNETNSYGKRFINVSGEDGIIIRSANKVTKASGTVCEVIGGKNISSDITSFEPLKYKFTINSWKDRSGNKISTYIKGEYCILKATVESVGEYELTDSCKVYINDILGTKINDNIYTFEIYVNKGEDLPVINCVDVTGYVEPQVGNEPVKPIKPEGVNYNISRSWYEVPEVGNKADAKLFTGIFEQDKVYCLAVTFYSSEGFEFGSQCKAYVDGKEVDYERISNQKIRVYLYTDLSSHSHVSKSTVTKATLTENGKIEYTCEVCGRKIKEDMTIYRPEAISLSQTNYTYDGTVKKPTIKVVDAAGKAIASTNYSVNYVNSLGTTVIPQNVGDYKAKVEFKGNYSGTKYISFTIGEEAGKWIKSNGKWWYRHADGTYTKNGWEKIDGKWYHFDASGYMQTGWQKLSNKWYYFDASGVMLTGWQKLSNKWYYFDASGVMLTGWQKLSNKWYYFDASGVMLTGWQKLSNKWYYFDASGVMLTGWQELNTKWYYFDASGVMQSACWVNKIYYMDSTGVMVTSAYIKDSSKYYWIDKNGKYTKTYSEKDTKGYTIYDQATGKKIS